MVDVTFDGSLILKCAPLLFTLSFCSLFTSPSPEYIKGRKALSFRFRTNRIFQGLGAPHSSLVGQVRNLARMIEESLPRSDRWMPSSFTVYMAAVFAVIAISVASKRRLAYIQVCNRIPGPPAPLPLLGNALELLRDPDGKLYSFIPETYDSNHSFFVL